MSLTLKQSHAIRQIAGVLYDFLPGSGHQKWQGHVSFATVARDLGLADFWQPGSKEPAIARLLELTLGKRQQHFEALVLTVVNNGLTYRRKNGRPVRREEIEALNGLLMEVGFKFPDLWAEDFLDSLSGDPMARARDLAQQTGRVQAAGASQPGKASALFDLRQRFYRLAGQNDRQAAGYDLEKLLNELFRLVGLDPRTPFRVTGEQIDGSFSLDHETYLVEVKWTAERVSEGKLLEFRGKVEGKSAFTRGAFISVNGFTDQAVEAITRGKQPTFFLNDGYDLVTVLEGEIGLPLLLRLKLRKLTEEGRVFVSARELLSPGFEEEERP